MYYVHWLRHKSSWPHSRGTKILLSQKYETILRQFSEKQNIIGCVDLIQKKKESADHLKGRSGMSMWPKVESVLVSSLRCALT